MSLNSSLFILIFLPVCLTGYFICARHGTKTAMMFLTAASIVFFAIADIHYLWILIGAILLNYQLGKCLQKKNMINYRSILLVFSVLVNLSLLFYFKYFNFFLKITNTVFGSEVIFTNIAIPLGISFMTFQQLSYLIDCYLGKAKNCSLLEYALYTAYFPKIIQGPICNHSELINEFRNPSVTELCLSNVNRGLFGFSIGFAKKVLIADFLSKLVNTGFSQIGTLSSIDAAFVVLAYSFQIYFDFSGYCDMASGVSLMFNINLPVNFNSPYQSISIQDFWKRWHITLTRFLTQYIYIPLGGNRKGVIRTNINVLIVFLVSGLWHGANYNFIVWGLMHGICIYICRNTKSIREKVPSILNWLITFILINISWIFFRADSLSSAVMFLSKFFSGGISINSTLFASLIPDSLSSSGIELLRNLSVFWAGNAFVVMAVIIAILLIICVFSKNSQIRVNEFRPTVMNIAICTLFILLSLLSQTAVTSFLYSNF